MTPPTITIARFEALSAEIVGSRSGWGECFWTARDLSLANQPELPDPLKLIADAAATRLQRLFLHGTAA